MIYQSYSIQIHPPFNKTQEYNFSSFSIFFLIKFMINSYVRCDFVVRSKLILQSYCNNDFFQKIKIKHLYLCSIFEEIFK